MLRTLHLSAWCSNQDVSNAKESCYSAAPLCIIFSPICSTQQEPQPEIIACVISTLCLPRI